MTLGTASAATDAAEVTVSIPGSVKKEAAGQIEGSKSLIVPQIAVPSSTTSATQVNFDALAIAIAQQNNSIAAQSNFLTLATMVLAVFGIFIAISWGKIIESQAEKIAKDAVDAYMSVRRIPRGSTSFLNEIVPNNIDDGIQNPTPSPRTMTQAEQEVQLGNDPA